MPTWVIHFQVLGSELTVRISRFGIAFVTQSILLLAGIHTLLATHPLSPWERRTPGWIALVGSYGAPNLLVLANTVILLAMTRNPSYRLPVILGCGAVLASILWLQQRIAFREPESESGDGALLSAATHVLVLGLLLWISQSRLRSLVSATAVLSIAFLGAWSLLGDLAAIGRGALDALVIGLCLAEITWALNYGRYPPRLVGLLLFLLFYVSTGLVRQFHLRRLSRRVAIEYGLVGLGGLLALSWLFQ